jgi:hypothetical protein
MKKIDDLKALDLPEKKYAIFGSSPIAVRNIRETEDIDIIVKKDLWLKLLKTHKDLFNPIKNTIEINNIEICKNWFHLTPLIDEMINNAEIIGGLPYVQLKYVIEWKKFSTRKKDIEDMKLIKNYLKSQPS